MSFFNNPENNSLKILLLVVVLAGIGAFVFYSKNSSEDTTGRVINSTSMSPVTSTPAPAMMNSCTGSATTSTNGDYCELAGPGCGQNNGHILNGQCCEGSEGTSNCHPMNMSTGSTTGGVKGGVGASMNTSVKAPMSADHTMVGSMMITQGQTYNTSKQLCKAGKYQGANGGCFTVASDCSYTYTDKACPTDWGGAAKN